MPNNAYARVDRRIELTVVNADLGGVEEAVKYPVTVFITVQVSVGEGQPGSQKYCPLLSGAANPQAVANQMVRNFEECTDYGFNPLFANLMTGASESPGVTQALDELDQAE